jgi:hypothetical protein
LPLTEPPELVPSLPVESSEPHAEMPSPRTKAAEAASDARMRLRIEVLDSILTFSIE